MTIYLVREVSRSPSEAKADRSPEPAQVATLPDVKPPPVRLATPTPPPPRIATDDVAPKFERTPPVEEVQPPASARIMPTGPNPKLDAIMGEANRAYDQGEFEEAKQIAQKVLVQTPNNVRMIRIVVSSECIAGDSAEAQKYFAQLPVADRAQMRTRCDRYGVTLKDP
jgi:predicted Zn-dependent protease